ncbi:hypothetical protein BJX63DRAFT_398296 [Aspergillus granulosus]|uniref:Uncharacterized protein n=1 Tax=Aspergillus granulosus TaxID=176169 RepID=A0ABR4H8K9_9EURO
MSQSVLMRCCPTWLAIEAPVLLINQSFLLDPLVKPSFISGLEQGGSRHEIQRVFSNRVSIAEKSTQTANVFVRPLGCSSYWASGVWTLAVRYRNPSPHLSATTLDILQGLDRKVLRKNIMNHISGYVRYLEQSDCSADWDRLRCGDSDSSCCRVFYVQSKRRVSSESCC